MQIKGFISLSLSDWDSKVCSVIFLPGCNFRCPFCYNKSLVVQHEKMSTIAQDQIEKNLETNRKWIDGVVVTGGEPTIHQDLPVLCNEMKKMGYQVKVDTNGTHPEMIGELIEKELVDYVAMDVKAPLIQENYSKCSGINAAPFLDKINETIWILLNDKIDYEFRTTLVPTLHQTDDLERICHAIKGCKRYVLQNFKSDVETIDPTFQDLKPFPKMQVEAFFHTVKKIVNNAALRG
jgi:pyruvate formate lyase activating enzyme